MPGLRDEVRSVWERFLRPAIERNPRHERYVYLFDSDDSDVILAVQQYSDASAAAAFLLTDEYRAYVAEVEPLLSQPPSVRRGEVLWTK